MARSLRSLETRYSVSTCGHYFREERLTKKIPLCSIATSSPQPPLPQGQTHISIEPAASHNHWLHFPCGNQVVENKVRFSNFRHAFAMSLSRAADIAQDKGRFFSRRNPEACKRNSRFAVSQPVHHPR